MTTLSTVLKVVMDGVRAGEGQSKRQRRQVGERVGERVGESAGERKDAVVSGEAKAPGAERAEDSRPRIPIGQVLFDEVFLWFFLSLVISLVIYNAWGLMDLVRQPVLP